MIFYKPLKSFLEEYNDKNVDNKYKTVAVGKYGIRTRESIYSKELAKDYSKNKLIYKNTLTVGMGSKQIDIGILSDDHVFSVSPAYHTFKISNINPDYLRYCLQARNPDMFIRYVKRGSRQGKAIDLKRWLTYEIPIHEKLVQKEIVKTLDVVKDLLEAYKEELDRYDELVKSRFVEMFGDLKSNTKGWNINTFEELTYLITDGEHATPRRTDKGIYLLSARNVLNHSIQLENVDYIDQEEYDRIAKRVIPQAGDVLISCSGTVGRCCKVPEGLKFQMVRSAALLRFKEIINPVFAEYMVTSDYLQEQINSSKTASSQANLFQGKIKALKGIVPPRELQDEFADFVVQVDKSKLTLCRYNVNVNK